MIEVIDGVEVKYCPRCEEHLPVEMFGKKKKASDGLQGYCKSCKHNALDDWVKNNPNYYSQYKKNWRAEHPEYGKEYYSKNSEYIKQKNYRLYHYDLEIRNKMLFRGRLSNAVRDGKIIKPDECTLCGSTERIQGHHTSYEPGHELDVVWVCAACHASIHIQLRREEESNE